MLSETKHLIHVLLKQILRVAQNDITTNFSTF